MIRAKLISPTNLLLEHPLFFSHREETEFVVLGRKEYERHRRDWLRFGFLLGAVVTTVFAALFSIAIAVLK